MKIEWRLNPKMAYQPAMKTAVLIPSHINYSDQIERFDRCLNSLCSQTIIPDIFVSVSFGNDIYKCEFSTLIRKYPTVKFKLSAVQKFQMEHLKILSVLVTNYDLIMFCDDDDTYLPNRVEIFIDTYREGSVHTDKEFGGVRECTVKEMYGFDSMRGSSFPEYWAYGISPKLLIEFFERMRGYEDLMAHKFADTYLRHYLRRTKGRNLMFATLLPSDSGDTLYQYTIDNPNSICARHKNLCKCIFAVGIIDELTLSLMEQNNPLIRKLMTHTTRELNEIVPNADRIKSLTKNLYA